MLKILCTNFMSSKSTACDVANSLHHISILWYKLTESSDRLGQILTWIQLPISFSVYAFYENEPDCNSAALHTFTTDASIIVIVTALNRF